MPLEISVFKTQKVSAENLATIRVWSGATATGFAGGNGTKDSPYRIATGEQLALALTSSYCNKSFILLNDIYLNDIYSENWKNKQGCKTWFDSHRTTAFTGVFDGNGYVVYGIYFNNEAAPSNTYIGLFPRIGGSAEIKNVGVSHAYIKATMGDGSVYAGGLFGMGSAFYDFYNNKTTPAETIGDEFLIPGNSVPTKLPSFTNCFVDHTCYFEANSVGGIGCAGGAAIVVRNCIVTASLVGSSDSASGGLIGPNWANCSRVYNSVSFPQTDTKCVAGNQQWVNSSASNCMALENVYYHGRKEIFGATNVSRVVCRVGSDAKNAMPELDWQNTWRVEEDGTPVLRIFDKPDRSASIFSDKQFPIPTTTISFVTGDSNVTVEPIVGRAYSPANLPTPTREGYIFAGWHAYEDLSLEYPYDYFLERDITLYASWDKITVTQDFENYLYTEYDCDTSYWRYNRLTLNLGDILNYKKKYVRSGSKSMHYSPKSSESTSLLLSYNETLTEGQQYTISLYVATDKSNFSSAQIAIAHKAYPDYLDADVLIEPIATLSGLKAAQWVEYEYTFTARSPWIALKVFGSESLYFDDITISPATKPIVDLNINDGSKTIKTARYFKSNFKRANISKGVTKIKDFAFAASRHLESVFIPDTVTSVEQYAFYRCRSLTDIWYAGTPEQAESIIIAANNEALLDATWHYNSCGLATEHTYDNDNDSSCNNCGSEREVTILGDTNSDGAVNNQDLGMLIQYLNDWDVVINTEAADVNGDGAVNNQDLGMLIQYLNDWDVEFKRYVKSQNQPIMAL